MRSKISLAWSIIIICSAGIIFTLVIIFSMSQRASLFNRNSQIESIASTGEAMQTDSSTVPAGPGLPVRLIIPSIGIDAAIEYVGVTPQKILGVPAGPTDVAWFDLGPRPGEQGTAVIDGHEGWKDNIPAVFDDLHELQKGDEIYVQDASGTQTTFVVAALETYGKNQDTSDVFSSPDAGTVHLNLITCEGVWNAATQSYSGRLVVFADEQ
jgi:LPXTG-site transpeptidase (sortase) family protein